MDTPLSPEEKQQIVEIVTSLLQRLEVGGEISLQEDGETLEIVIETPDTGIVIGYHGEVLEALQLIVSLMIARKLGRYIRISIEIGDYKKNRRAYLEKLAMQMKERVSAEQREHTISNLKSWERRIVHLLLQDDPEVTSESLGEGKDRVLVIKPRV